jgi:hypothetical protein
MPVGLGVERVDVLAVLGQRLRHRLALGGRMSFSTRCTLARRSSSVWPCRAAASLRACVS